MRSKGIKKKFIDEKHDYSKGMTETIALIKKVDECKETSPITHYTCRESLSEKITITISNKSLFKRHDNKFEINKPVLVNEVKRAIIHFFERKEKLSNYILALTENGRFTLSPEQYIIPIIAVDISSAVLINGRDDEFLLSELNRHIDEANENNRNNDADSLDEKNKYVDKFIEYFLFPHSFTVTVEFNGWFLPIHLSPLIEMGNGRYDFTNVKYRNYKIEEENTIIEHKPHVSLLLGRYGYLYCDVLEYPKGEGYFIQQHKNLIKNNNESHNKNNNESHNKNNNEIISRKQVLSDGSLFHFIADAVSLRNKSTLAKAIINTKNEMIKAKINMFNFRK